jgi:hypothetical protein
MNYWLLKNEVMNLMQIFLHVFYTWLLTNLLHPVIFFCIPFFTRDESGLDSFFLAVVMGITLFTLFVSIPGLFIGWMILNQLKQWPAMADVKFIIWILLILVIIFCSYQLLLYVIEGPVWRYDDLIFVLPVSVAGFLAIVFRYRQFIKLFSEPEIITDEKIS